MVLDVFGLYLEDNLTVKSSVLYEEDKAKRYWMKNPSLNMTRIIPDLPLGVRNLETGFTLTEYGTAAIYDGQSNDIPLVDVLLESGKMVPALIFITGAKWSQFDLITERNAKRNGTNIPSLSIISRKLKAMGTWLNEREHDSLLYGIPNRNFYGLTNQPDVTTVDTAATVPNFYDGTTQAIYEQFLEWIADFMDAADLTSSSQVHVKIPESFKRILAMPYDGANPSGGTLWSMLTNSDQAYYIGKITANKELEGTNLNEKGILPVATKDMFIFQAMDDPDGLETHIFPRTRTEVKPNMLLDYLVGSYSSMSTLFLNKPETMQYLLVDNQRA